jgi:2-(3-amino-3-carboxypropyl)histidine synthase
MLQIDKSTLVKLIEEKKPRLLLVSCPSGLLLRCMDLLRSMSEMYKFEVIFSGESCYGICDSNEDEASRLKVDLSVHIGHNSYFSKIGHLTYLIDAFDDIDIIPVLEHAVSAELIHYNKIGLCTIGPHLHKIEDAKSFLESKNHTVFVGEATPPLKRGQIFGCNFSTCAQISPEVEAFVFIGSSRFHAIGLYKFVEKPVFMLDPYTIEVISIEKDALKIRKRSIFSFYKAVEAKNIGIIIGLKEGQSRKEEALHLHKELSQLEKNVSLIAMKEITNYKINEFRNIEVFIETACPRISEDFYDKPILSLEQGYKLLEYLKNKSSV